MRWLLASASTGPLQCMARRRTPRACSGPAGARRASRRAGPPCRVISMCGSKPSTLARKLVVKNRSSTETTMIGSATPSITPEHGNEGDDRDERAPGPQVPQSPGTGRTAASGNRNSGGRRGSGRKNGGHAPGPHPVPPRQRSNRKSALPAPAQTAPEPDRRGRSQRAFQALLDGPRFFPAPFPPRPPARRNAPSCARAWRRPCRRDGVSRRVPRRPGSQSGGRLSAPHRSPSRLTMTAGCSKSVPPSGRPQTARVCCSNWLVRQASNVRWPGVVRARRQFVDQQRAGRREKHLDRQQAAHVQGRRSRARASSQRVGEDGRRETRGARWRSRGCGRVWMFSNTGKGTI